jgi:hypothetical protein
MKPISRERPGRLPEHELLACCARTNLDSESAARVAALVQEGIDWDYLIRAATDHGLLPLLRLHLPDDIPQTIFNRLKELSQLNSRFNLLLTGELVKLQRLFQSHDVSVVPFKGPILAACVYGDIGLRQFSDLDFLVRKQDVFKAGEILISAGYLPRYRLGATQRAAMVEQRCEEAFDRDDDATTVDLHWSVIPARFSFAPDTDEIWGRLERVSLLGSEVLTVAPEDLVMLLSVHGAKHAWERLSWICDLAELIRARASIDWGSVIETASRNGGQRILFLGLFLASDLLSAPLPTDVFERVRADSRVKLLAAKVYANLFRGIDRQCGVLETDRFYLQSMTRLKDRVHLCLDHLKPTPLEWQMVRLPHYLSFFYYPLRPVRIIEKHWQSLTKRIISK